MSVRPCGPATGLEPTHPLLKLVLDAKNMARRCTFNPLETRVDRDWFQRLKLKYDEPLSSFTSMSTCGVTTWLRG